jgi:glucosamine kinase
MIVIADSGSTKADWKIIGPEKVESLNTMGFNPVFHTDDLIATEVEKAFSPLLSADDVSEVYFYGSGCWDLKRKSVISRALERFFTTADVQVDHDLLGAARASCGHEPGIACIIGTGSNSCLYDGEQVVDNITNLGYLIGDEGSGTHLGKRLIRAYFYRELPPDLESAMKAYIPGGESEILDKVYEGKQPNVYMASFTRFLSQHQSHFFVQRLLYKSIAEFIDRHVRKYNRHTELPVHFIGSVAYHFQEIIKIVLAERHLKVGKFIQKPIDQLVDYHLTAVS